MRVTLHAGKGESVTDDNDDGHMLAFDRFGIITASVVPAILRSEGCTQSRKWAFRVITGREKERPPGWDIQRGLDNEQNAIEAVEIELGLLATQGGFVLHPSLSWLGASPDSFLLIDDLRIPVEAKCPRVLHSSVPPMYYDQMQTQLEVCDVPFGYYVSWVEDGQWVEKVMRDSEWWRVNKPILEGFYRDFIERDIEPPTSSRRKKEKQNA